VSEFKPAFEEVLTWEGGFQKNPRDRGNWTSGIVGVGQLRGTNMGISAMSFPEITDIEHMAKDDAAYFYKRDWWRYDNIVDQLVANKMLNMAVNWQRYGGHGPAIHVLQMAINKINPGVEHDVTDDGTLGPKTINAANAIAPVTLLNEMRRQALARYKAIEQAHPEDKAFFTGWERRAIS